MARGTSAHQVITATGRPSANHDQRSPQWSDTSALSKPLAVSTPSTHGQSQREGRAGAAGRGVDGERRVSFMVGPVNMGGR